MAKYCGNCGTELNDNQDICLKCGAKVKKETSSSASTSKSAGYCGNCGAELNLGQEICLKCGVRVNNSKTNKTGKSKIAAGILGIFLGGFGVHNFYLGFNGKAITQLLLSILSCFFLYIPMSIWGLIEGILILCGNINEDADGNELVD